MKQLEQKYNHLKVEDGLYEEWLKEGYFTAGDIQKKPYTIVIPPPNVTGKLHLGHAWDNTLQDIIARYKRLNNYDVLYLPGMDHAGIATQAKIEGKLKEEGISRYDLGREKFLEKAWEWKRDYATHIREQWASMGISLDYTRERFTLDDGLNKAVNKVFCDLYQNGLIYQDYKIINWDPVAKTALSNIEVYHQEVSGKMYYFNYQVKEKDSSFVVATTRPETMFADVCIVVHPDDERYQDLIGLHAINPANDDLLPIIADDYIDLSFGSGAMKCTPAHDPNDFLIAERHHLEKPICMNPDATMNEMAKEFNGLDRYDCRVKLVEKIKNEGNLVKIEDIVHQVGHSERTHTIVEPYLSKQWFVKMKPLADDVLKYQKDSATKINFYPARFEKTFNMWLENIEDWCISRQLWWGHRIPAYYSPDKTDIYVGDNPPAGYVQDEDVLDTWFSSALWPFSTLGWPNETKDLKRYYPTNCMVTGYDIIFFWVARMAIQARYFTHQYPFKDVLIHGLIRDAKGQKMSKSLGNGIDPLAVKEKYGFDALRFFLTTNSAPGQDVRYIEEKVEASANFINKLWNASRFVMMNIENEEVPSIETVSLSSIDKWILNQYNAMVKSFNDNMNKYEFAIAGNELYHFIWNDYCNWYIELSKSKLNSEDSASTKATLCYLLNNILILLHPFIPFVTDRIYTALNEKSIHHAKWPTTLSINTDDIKVVDQLISAIQTIREIKVENDLKPSEAFEVSLENAEGNSVQLPAYFSEILLKMTKCTLVDTLTSETIKPVLNGKLVYHIEKHIDIEAEKAKLELELKKLQGEIDRAENILKNENFLAKAPESKVNAEKEKLSHYRQQYQIVLDSLNNLK